jgi:thiol-disulfide isomerase/thioredoxin
MRHLACVAAVALTVGSSAWAQEELAAEGKQAPIFRLPLYNPQASSQTFVGLDRYVGPDATEKDVKVVLLSFMASYCAPCKKELPYLQRLHEVYGELGLRVMSVSIDTEPEGQKQVEEMIAASKVTFPVLKDRFNLVARRWLGTEAKLPSVFMVNPDAMVSMVHRGYDRDVSVILANDIESRLGIVRPPGSKPMVEPIAEAAVAEEVKPAAGTGKGQVKKATGKTKGKKDR